MAQLIRIGTDWIDPRAVVAIRFRPSYHSGNPKDDYLSPGVLVDTAKYLALINVDCDTDADAHELVTRTAEAVNAARHADEIARQNLTEELRKNTDAQERRNRRPEVLP